MNARHHPTGPAPVAGGPLHEPIRPMAAEPEMCAAGELENLPVCGLWLGWRPATTPRLVRGRDSEEFVIRVELRHRSRPFAAFSRTLWIRIVVRPREILTTLRQGKSLTRYSRFR